MATDIMALIVVLVLTGVIIGQSIEYHTIIKRERKQNQDLLNRLMARDFSDYAARTIALQREEEKKASRFHTEDQEEAKAPENDGLGMPVG